jgi:hypothetical protein
MIRNAVFLSLAGTFAVLSATPTTSSADSSGCRQSEPTAISAYLHDAQIHVTDGLSNYSNDLSDYGTPRPIGLDSHELRSEPPERRALDTDALRTYFHGPAFRSPDGLANYGQDYRVYDTPPRDGGLAQVVQTRP